ncbi:MAG TPA: DUF72 domain-containing protein [Pirellulaceae bacterium]|jgi:uncharacterized protein YecE (DUF72 family)|nr:DUF72 domain-containing protein [Pirellulaceae bacterium]
MSKPESKHPVRIGCAGWSLPKEHAASFPGEGTHLDRYARRLPASEINSTFYRSHRPSTYEKWAASAPADFRFAVKAPKEVTHKRRLAEFDAELDQFLTEVSSLGTKLGPLLVQLPPSLDFSAAVADTFFASLRERFDGEVVLEPRHPSWFENPAERLVKRYRVARVAADPTPVGTEPQPGGWDGLVYYRLHGSPRMYYSAYSDEYLDALSAKLSAAARSAAVWCIFDNTAGGAAAANAVDLLNRVLGEQAE